MAKIDRRTLDKPTKKIKFLRYYAKLPILKLAGESVGITSDTVSIWRSEDPDFSEEIDNLHAAYALSHSNQVKSPEWLLERVYREHYSPRTELTGAEGASLSVTINDSTLTPKRTRKGK
jgi:hypothetical protein